MVNRLRVAGITLDTAPTPVEVLHVAIERLSGLIGDLDQARKINEIIAVMPVNAGVVANSTAPDVATLVTDFNNLLTKLRSAGVIS